MVLEARVVSGLLGLRRRVEIAASCTRSGEIVQEPEIGCGQCHLDFPAIAIQEDDL
jgi:hypothetical protein